MPSPRRLQKHAVRPFAPPALQRQRSYDPVRLPPWPLPFATSRTLPSPLTVSPITEAPSDVPCLLPRRIERVLLSIASRPAAFPKWQEGRHPQSLRDPLRLHSGNTARRILSRPRRLCRRFDRASCPPAARQLPDLSTIIRVESSSTDDPRPRGALPLPDNRFKSTQLRAGRHSPDVQSNAAAVCCQLAGADRWCASRAAALLSMGKSFSSRLALQRTSGAATDRTP